MDAKICPSGKAPVKGKCRIGKVAAIFTAEFQFETGGKKVNATKIAKGLAKQMDRQYIGHSADRFKNKVKGKLVTARKGERLTQAQKTAAKKLL